MKKIKKNNSRLEETFRVLKEKGETALITFITAGDPSLQKTKEIVLEMEKSGADIVELGIPFSDPMADGPTIQGSSERALARGTKMAGVLKLLSEIRKKTSIPVVLFGYYNPIFNYGLKKFSKAAKKAGADGLLVVDLPPEESGDLKKELDCVELDLIYLLTPTSDESRMRVVSKVASGFIYYVSLTGVTGARKKVASNVSSSIKKLRRFTKLPVAVGFGVSTTEQVRAFSKCADGVVVGSAIVNLIAKEAASKKMPRSVGSFIAKLKKGAKRS
ncbi:MAG: tryptophan synthase subunit alpha [Deltaproteobacteria bacterium]|nr:tryptophan synthase subunit alpha [Deltaproteobacteria bacterium]